MDRSMNEDTVNIIARSLHFFRRRRAPSRVAGDRSVSGDGAAAAEDLSDAEPRVHLRGEERADANLRALIESEARG